MSLITKYYSESIIQTCHKSDIYIYIYLRKNDISNVSLFGIELLHGSIFKELLDGSIFNPILTFQGVNILCFAKQVGIWNL